MIPTILRKNPMLSWCLAFLGLGVFWFYVMIHPWLGFQNSDTAIPFQMTVTPWVTQDLFYWGTSRMGMIYEVVWKAALSLLGLRESVIGSELNTELFYLGHTLLSFLGFPFWLETLPSRRTKLIFFALFLPLTHVMHDYMLSPGQPYGVVFTLTGMFLWTLLKRPETLGKQLCLSVLMGLLYIQHELAALITFGLYGIHYGLAPFKVKRFLMMWAVMLFFFVLARHFRIESGKWSGPGAHYQILDLTSFLYNLWYTVRDGTWMLCVRRGTGHPIFLGILVYFVYIIKNLKTKPFYRDVYQSAFLGAILAYILVHLTQWYVINNKSPRYFTNLIPILIWAFLIRMEEMPKWNFSRVVLLLACVIPIYSKQAYGLWLNPIVRTHFYGVQASMSDDLERNQIGPYPQDLLDRDVPAETRETLLFQLSPTWSSEYGHLLAMKRMQALAQSVQEQGCASYIDNYWNSHILNLATFGRILTSAGNHIRNPELFEKVLSARPLCVMPREDVPFQKYISGLDCSKTPYGFLVCRDPAK